MSWSVTLLVIGVAWLSPALAQSVQPASAASGEREVSFSFQHKGISVPVYKLAIREDGSGNYSGQEVISASGLYANTTLPPQDFDRSIRISAATVSHVFEMARRLDHFNTTCASKAKNVADTGTKVLSYTSPDGSGSCTYNYSEVKDVQALTDAFEGIAETMDRGRQLDRLHRFDRLGLDEAMSFLVQEVSDGRALELGNIQGSLSSIANDADVIERVRTKATMLLRLIPSDVAQR